MSSVVVSLRKGRGVEDSLLAGTRVEIHRRERRWELRVPNEVIVYPLDAVKQNDPASAFLECGEFQQNRE